MAATTAWLPAGAYLIADPAAVLSPARYRALAEQKDGAARVGPHRVALFRVAPGVFADQHKARIATDSGMLAAIPIDTCDQRVDWRNATPLRAGESFICARWLDVRLRFDCLELGQVQ